MRYCFLLPLVGLLAACASSPSSRADTEAPSDFESIADHPAVSRKDVFVSNIGISITGLHLMSDRPMVIGASDLKLAVSVPINRLYEVRGTERIEPDQFKGMGVSIEGRRNVTLRGFNTFTSEAHFRFFKVGIYAKNCENLVFDGLTFADMFRQRLHSTPDREDTRDWLWPHNNDNREWMTNYGACIVLENCKNCVVRNCSARGTQNGIILDKCEGCQVHNNDFSYCSGWGCALWRSCKNTVAQNRFDYCVRGYSHGVYARGQDSAGILVFEQCCDNTFAYNSATHGGDGFFLYAGHETTQISGKGGCNRNLVYGNDFSYAVANGIEATFSDGNVFAKNKLVGCDYGIWGGYSYNTLISDNEIADSLTAGIAIEHGHDNWIEGNTFTSDRTGVWLWWDEDKDLTGGEYGQKQNTKSERTTIRRNHFKCMRALRIADTSETRVEENEINYENPESGVTPLPAFLRVEGRINQLRFARNNIWHFSIEDTSLAADSPKIIFDENRAAVRRFPASCEGDPENWPNEPFDTSTNKLERTVTEPHGIPDTRGLEPLYLGNSGGRETMVIGPWGPIDVVSLAPGLEELSFGHDENRAGVHWVLEGRNTTLLQIVGDQGFDLEIRTINPFLSRVAISPRKPGWFEYQFDFIANVSISLRGTVLRADWSINFWQWTPAEGSELPPDWDKLVASPPLKTVTKPSLDYNIQGGAPEDGVPADHFATVATTEIELPAGSWKLTLTSDDGARLFVDGEKVIERWDIHGPTDDVYTLKLEKPRKVKLRIEHFENTGWAALAFRIERE